MSLTLTVHRGTRQIGGTCIEIQGASGERLILDTGRPLDAPEGANDIVPSSLNRNRPATVVISHPHQDHWGVVDQLPASWQIWTGSKSAQLIAIPCDLLRGPLTRTFNTWNSRTKRFAVGPFAITPILTDYSAFDAYMLQIETDGKRILCGRIRLALFMRTFAESPAAHRSAYTVDHAKSTNPARHIAAYRPGQRSTGPDLVAGSSGALRFDSFFSGSDEVDRRSRKSPHTLG